MQPPLAIAISVVSIATAITTCVAYTIHQQELTKREAVKAGLVQVLPPGGYTPIWTKP